MTDEEIRFSQRNVFVSNEELDGPELQVTVTRTLDGIMLDVGMVNEDTEIQVPLSFEEWRYLVEVPPPITLAEPVRPPDSPVVDRVWRRYEVGNPDPTPDSGPYCGASHENGCICTWAPGHEHPQHVAGTGKKVAAVWDVER